MSIAETMKSPEKCLPDTSFKNIEIERVLAGSPRWEEIIAFVTEHDREFVPPLSERMPIRDYIERFRNDNGVLLAAYGPDGIAGCMASFLRHPERGTPFVQFAAVLREYRKAGIGVMLLQRTLKEIAEAGCTRVESRTWSTNTASQNLLASEGFVLTERLIDDRSPGIDTLIYERSV